MDFLEVYYYPASQSVNNLLQRGEVLIVVDIKDVSQMTTFS